MRRQSEGEENLGEAGLPVQGCGGVERRFVTRKVAVVGQEKGKDPRLAVGCAGDFSCSGPQTEEECRVRTTWYDIDNELEVSRHCYGWVLCFGAREQEQAVFAGYLLGR